MYRHLLALTALSGLVLGVLALSAQAQERPATRRPSKASLGILIGPAREGAKQEGVAIRDVLPGSPAAKAGLQKGDIITQVDNREIDDPDTLINLLSQHQGGDKLTFHMKQDGQERDISVTLGERRAMGTRGSPAPEAAQGSLPHLGVQLMPIDALSDREKQQLKISSEEGIVVRQVQPNSPAAKAGFHDGDVLTRVGDRAVDEPADVLQVLSQHKPGDQLAFQVQREGKEQSLTATLAEPETRQGRAGEPTGQAPNRAQRTAFLGVETMPAGELTAGLKRRLGITGDHGLVVIEVVPESPAARAGLQHGDVIRSVNGQDVASQRELRERINQAGVDHDIALQIMRGDQQKELQAKLEALPEGFIGMAPFEGRGGARRSGYGPGEQGGSSREVIERLERRIEHLEKRLQELEQKQAPANPK